MIEKVVLFLLVGKKIFFDICGVTNIVKNISSVFEFIVGLLSLYG
jgi:hypothetical protein